MKRVKIFGLTVIILILSMAGGFCGSHAVSGKEAAGGNIKTYEGKRTQLSSVHGIEADLEQIDLKIVSTKKQKSSLSYSIYCKNSKNPFGYHVKNGVLYLKESGLKGLSNKEREQEFGKKWWKYRSRVTVYLPEKSGVKKVNVTKGDLIVGKKVHFGDMDIQMKEGDIVISGLSVSGATKINMDKGDCVANTVTVSGNMQITAKEGDILANGLKVSGKLQIHSDEGDILVTKIDKKYFDAMTITADAFDGNILALGMMRDGKVKEKGDGWCYKKNGTGKGTLEIVAKEGDILLK